jgi:hypothetical protein
MASNQIRITQQHFLVVAALLFLVHPTHQQGNQLSSDFIIKC